MEEVLAKVQLAVEKEAEFKETVPKVMVLGKVIAIAPEEGSGSFSSTPKR